MRHAKFHRRSQSGAAAKSQSTVMSPHVNRLIVAPQCSTFSVLNFKTKDLQSFETSTTCNAAVGYSSVVICEISVTRYTAQKVRNLPNYVNSSKGNFPLLLRPSGPPVTVFCRV